MTAELANRTEHLNTVEEVAGRIRKGRTYTWNLVRAGEIKSFKLGNRRLVTESAIADFIARASQADDE